MDLTDKAISTLKNGLAAIAASMDKGLMTFQRPTSLIHIHKSHITAVHITAVTVTIHTDDGREAIYAVVKKDDNSDYLAVIHTLAKHDYFIPAFADLKPTAK